jgi:hypothetical protein
MAITVKHSKVSTIPDDADTSLVRPSDWNADHTLTGTVPVANGGTGAATLTGYVYGNGTAAMTASTTIPSGDVSGLGTMATQNANAVAVTGGSINGTTVGATTASSGAFTYASTSSSTNTTPVLSYNASNCNFSLGGTTASTYLQAVMQNKSGTAGASTNFAVSNDLGTDSTYYGEFGMNSSVFSTGTPADFFSLNNGIYYSGHDGDITYGSGNGYKTFLAWGTTGQSAHVINASGAIGLNTNITGTTNFGTSGQVLTSAGSSATPTWTTPTTGSVTSVAQSFTGGIISVGGSPITTSGTLALTVAGTSGGIPYFSSNTTWATSAALTANALMIGGGAGVAPSTITTGTGVNTALGVNTGSAGAFVVNGGSLGTPSSGTVTNLTGTASININGTVGATTANTGAFTTLSASSQLTLTNASDYNLYASGAGANYMAGALGIGSTTLTQYGLRIGKTITGATTSFGARIDGIIQSDVTANATFFSTNAVTAAASFTCGLLYHFQATQGTLGAGSAVTTQVGYFASSNLLSATNNYAFQGATAAATGAYNLYMSGTADNYIAGNLGIGSVSGLSTATILLSKAVTGGTVAYSQLINPTVLSDVTSTASGVRTSISTAASAFTLATLLHFRASQATIGSGSAVTTQAGFLADSTIIGATNNYGFRGQIAAATGRYNLYMDGTAANYFGGDMQFNKTVTAAGTTGAQTISKNAGTVNFAAAATSLVVTNTLVTANSIIICTVGTNDTTMKSVSAVAAAGSFTIYSNAAATAETRVNFIVIN